MTNSTTDADNPRPRTRKQIDGLLQQRQRMLVLMWELSKLPTTEVDNSYRDLLDEFLEVLVDYIAAGHFGLYRRISEGKERRAPVVDIGAEIYPRISETTDVSIDFSERYEAADDERVRNNLTEDLSILGEEIATRIELEDRLVLAMLGPDYTIPEVTTH